MRHESKEEFLKLWFFTTIFAARLPKFPIDAVMLAYFFLL